MKGFFLNKQSLLKSLVHKPSVEVSEEEAKALAPWYTGMSQRKAREERTTPPGAGGTVSPDS
jgi:hypothetical protein